MVRGSARRKSSACGTISERSPWRTTWMPREAQNREWSWTGSRPQIVYSGGAPPPAWAGSAGPMAGWVRIEVMGVVQASGRM
jgi:hypothetical protein